MKIGRRILENETFERKMELKEKIDCLEKDYHDAGCEVIQATRKLNEGMYEFQNRDQREQLKFTFSEKVTKIDKIFTVNLTVCSNCQIDGEDFINFVAFLENMNFKMPYMVQNFLMNIPLGRHFAN